jgi:hypothetical protein
MEKPIELNDVETAAVAGGLLNNIFVNLAPVSSSFNTNSFNNQSVVGNTIAWRSFNSFLSNNSI